MSGTATSLARLLIDKTPACLVLHMLNIFAGHTSSCDFELKYSVASQTTDCRVLGPTAGVGRHGGRSLTV